MKILLLLASIASVASAQINTCAFPLTCSGGTIRHASQDGTLHVPKTYGQGAGACLLTNGASGDAFWGSCPGASGGLDSARVRSIVHDTAITLRAYAMPAWSTANSIPKGNGSTGLTTSSWTDSASVLRTTTTDTLVAQSAALGDLRGATGAWVGSLGKNTGNGTTRAGAAFSGNYVYLDAPASGGVVLRNGGFNILGVTAGGVGVSALRNYGPDTLSTTSATVLGTNASGLVVDNSSATLSNNTTGSAAILTTARTIATSGDATGTATSFNGSANISIPTTVTKINGTLLSGLATGILKNTTTTGVPSIAVAADFPTLNQNTTGSAAKWTTPRNLTIGASTQALDGTTALTYSLAAIGAQVAGSYQPLENQRLSTSNSPTFATVSNPTGIWRANAIDATISAFYGASVSTPTDNNWSAQFANNGGGVGLQASSLGYLKIAGSNILTWNAYGVKVTGADTVTGALLVQGSGTAVNIPSGGTTMGGALSVAGGLATIGLGGDFSGNSVTSAAYVRSFISGTNYAQIAGFASGSNSAWFGCNGNNSATGSLWSGFTNTFGGASIIQSATGNTVDLRVAGVTVEAVSATGVAVTGDISALNHTTTVQNVPVSTTPAVNISNGGNVVIGASNIPGALTAATNITFTNPDIGSTTKVMFKQFTTSVAVTFTTAGYTFYRSGKTAGISSGSVVLAAADMTLSCFYEADITWLSATTAFVTLQKS